MNDAWDVFRRLRDLAQRIATEEPTLNMQQIGARVAAETGYKPGKTSVHRWIRDVPEWQAAAGERWMRHLAERKRTGKRSCDRPERGSGVKSPLAAPEPSDETRTEIEARIREAAADLLARKRAGLRSREAGHYAEAPG